MLNTRPMDAASADNAVTTLVQLLKALGVKVTPATVKRTLESHPEFPALSSLSDSLDRWRVDNAAFRLRTVEQLRELPLPFLIHYHEQGGLFRLVTRIEGDKLSYWDANTGTGQQSLADFERTWSGVVLVAETNADSGETEYALENRKERLKALRQPALYTLAGVTLMLTLSMLLPSLTLLQSGWLLTKTLGLALSIALLAKQFGSQNSLINRLCRVGAKTSCQSLLDGPAAKLWGWLSWAEIGTLYFAGGLCVALVGPNPLLGWLALSALPYTVFSVYYQARVARIWCPLCLGVQVVLLADGILSLTGSLLLVTLLNVTYIAMSFAIPALAWLLLKPVLTAAQRQQRDYHDLMAFKRSESIFKTLQREQEAMPAFPNHLPALQLGQPDAPHVMTIVTNPYCGPCAQKHKELEVLLRQSPAVTVRLIFLASEATDDKVTQLAQHLLALEQDTAHDALTAWFEQSKLDYKAWSDRFSLPANSDGARQTAIEHGRWCLDAGITSTPTVFLDGYRFPDLYQLSDIDWLLSREVKQSVS